MPEDYQSRAARTDLFYERKSTGLNRAMGDAMGRGWRSCITNHSRVVSHLPAHANARTGRVPLFGVTGVGANDRGV